MLILFSYSKVAIKLLSRRVPELTASEWLRLGGIFGDCLSKTLLKAGSAGAGYSGHVQSGFEYLEA